MLAGFAGFTWRITVTGEGEHPHQVKPSLTDGVGDLQHLFGTDAAAVMATVDFDENIDRASGVCEPRAGVRSALGGARTDSDASAVSQLTEPVGLACADPQ